MHSPPIAVCVHPFDIRLLVNPHEPPYPKREPPYQSDLSYVFVSHWERVFEKLPLRIVVRSLVLFEPAIHNIANRHRQ